MIPHSDREQVRERYRPRQISMLFVGESPPASGRFFYDGTGIACASTQRAFAQAFARTFHGPQEFLKFFRDAGCYLDDLSHDPVDHLTTADRIRAINSCTDTYARDLQEMQPKLIVVFLKRIFPVVERAASIAGFPGDRLIALPFPGNGHQNKYVAELGALLTRHGIHMQSTGLVVEGK
jgi:hypothetical protein